MITIMIKGPVGIGKTCLILKLALLLTKEGHDVEVLDNLRFDQLPEKQLSKITNRLALRRVACSFIDKRKIRLITTPSE